MVELDTSAADACPSVVQMAPSDIARRQFTKWNGIGAESVELTRRERFEFGYEAPCHLVVMSERAERVEGETLIDGAPTSMLHALGRKLSLVPGGHQLRGWQTPRALNGVTFFYLNPRGPLLDPELHFAETELKPRLYFFDQAMWETALKLKTEAENPGRAQQSYAEALGIVLAHELLRLNSHTAPPSQYISGGLAGWQQKRLVDYIEEHLASDPSLPELAAVAGLSPYHFARMFKQSFGLPPHRYLTGRRIEKAKHLLAKPALSVTRVGFDLGFSELSSFSSTFRKHVGLTPTDYRRRL